MEIHFRCRQVSDFGQEGEFKVYAIQDDDWQGPLFAQSQKNQPFDSRYGASH